MSAECTDFGLQCHGGPLHGQRLHLDCYKSGTLPFTLKGQTGRYVYERHTHYFNIGSFLKWESQQHAITTSAQATE